MRRLQLVGEDPQKFINQYTQAFKKEFLQLLRTSHGEKNVSLNAFYQSYIANKQHVHLNATRFHSLTEFAKHLGREGTCRITEEEGKGLLIAWIDNSPEALRRRDKLQRIERQNKNDSTRERKELQAQVDRAWQTSTAVESIKDEQDERVVRVSMPQKFSLPQQKHDAEVESKKRKNVFSRSQSRPNARSGTSTTTRAGKEPSIDHDESAKKRKTLEPS